MQIVFVYFLNNQLGVRLHIQHLHATLRVSYLHLEFNFMQHFEFLHNFNWPPHIKIRVIITMTEIPDSTAGGTHWMLYIMSYCITHAIDANEGKLYRAWIIFYSVVLFARI